ncbi:hypothetical protein C1E23_08975 [Pseudoalteromonas phenolica]|uniref:Uncharacterized protein n=1 Tax=Pseudoalteromonas phenolica TaxID=161398 RepID=A0A4Q7IMA9_9GAMM|nr:hypothetical protein [Pseudoalteromonas phenolica]RZQ53423.1 hypothetical protein C1E23_08975 [Pseudoalteromonas phenolica]
MQISRYVSEFNQGNTSYAFEQQRQSKVEPQEAVIHQTQVTLYNMVSGFNDGKTSVSEAYLIKNNDEMRQTMVEKNMLEHQAAMVDSYTKQLSV